MSHLLRRRPVKAVLGLGVGLALAASLSACNGLTTLQAVVGNVGPSFAPIGAPPTLQVGFLVPDAPRNQSMVCVVQVLQGATVVGTALDTEDPLPPNVSGIVYLVWVTVPADAMNSTAQDVNVNCVTPTPKAS